MNLGVVAQPQLDRVDAQCVGQLVQRGLHREVASRRARATHRIGAWNVQSRPPVVCRDVRAGVGVAGDLRDGLDLSVVQGPDRRGGLVIHRDQPTIAGGTQPHPLPCLRPVADGGEHLRPGQHQLDGAIDDPGRERGQDHVRPGAESVPEPASQVGNKDPDVGLR